MKVKLLNNLLNASKIVQFLALAAFFVACENEETPGDNSIEAYFESARNAIDGTIAYETTAYVEQFWRLPGNSGFDKSIYYVVEQLQEAGYVEESAASSEDLLTYRLESRPSEQPTWEPVSGKVSLSGEVLLDFESNRNMIAINSSSTAEGGVSLPVVEVVAMEDFNTADVAGKIVFAEMHPYQFFDAAMAGGAAGILSYYMPDYLQPEKNTTSIQFRSIKRTEKDVWGVILSYEAREKLKNALNAGEVVLSVELETKSYVAPELTVVAEVRGSESERLVFSAHVQEPGANDNASGTGALTEIAAAAAKLVKEDNLQLTRTLTMLWGDEISSTRRYIVEDSVRAETIQWGISLDMVGEDTKITGGSFLIEKMPDPSAIWTRGEDKHTEWGGRKMRIEEMTPHYFNDFVINRFKEQGEYANWEVNTNPYEGGSDHVPFLRANIPGLLLWHFTDQFYHTDNDRIDKVSQETLKNVATGALVTALTLVNSDETTGMEIAEELFKAASTRLATELELSKAALNEGGDKAEEELLMSTWLDWYLESLESVGDIAPESDSLRKAIDELKGKLESEYGSLGI